MVTNYIWFIVSLILCSRAQEAVEPPTCLMECPSGYHCGADGNNRWTEGTIGNWVLVRTMELMKDLCDADDNCVAFALQEVSSVGHGYGQLYHSNFGGLAQPQTQWTSCVKDTDDVCYEVSTSGWNCPNGMSIDGTYLLDATINNKQAWRKADGVYLRWASMWTQWIFDDDTEDITSVAWIPASMESVTPPTGTTNGFLYGSTCGNNGVGVSSLTITKTTCTEYIKLASLSGFCGSTNLGRPNVESVYPSTGSVGFLEYQNALGVEGCSHNLDDWHPNYKQCGGACYAVCEYLGKLECDRLGDQCAGFRIHGYYGTSLWAPDFKNCMSLHPNSNFGDDGFRIQGGWTFYYKPSTHEEMVALNTPKPSPAPTRKPTPLPTACDDFLVEYDGDDVAIQALVGTYQKRTDCDRSEGGANFGGVDISTCFEGPDSFLIWNTGCGWQIGKHEADDEMTDWKRRAMTYAGSCSQIPAEGKTTAALTTQSYFNGFGEVIVGLSSVCDPIADRRRLKVKQQSRLRRLLNLISDLE